MTRLMEVQEEIFTHEYLWRSSTEILDKSEGESPYTLIPDLLMAFLAYEAFVNFLGHVLAPELWVDEKTNFKSKGLEGRLGAVVARLPNYQWNKGANPYQAVKRLEDFRDMVAHGKVIASEYVAAQKDDGTHFRYQHPWDEYLSLTAVVSARNSIKEFSQSLLNATRQISDEPHLICDAYDGSLAHASSSSVRS